MEQTVRRSSPPSIIRRGPRPRWFNKVTPWFWIAPTVFFVGLFLFYPMINTIWWSFLNDDSTSFVGLKNFQTIFTNKNIVQVLVNNVLWLVVGTLATVLLGLIIAALVDRVRFEGAAKIAIFIPMAISFVGASVIWKLVYDYQTSDKAQTGLLNAIVTGFGGRPQAWLVNMGTNNIALIIVYAWIWTGFCMVILSAALKSIPTEIIEAARSDGANSITIFLRITVPMISPTIAVVTTTMIINVLKIFDVIYVMTGGNYNTNVIALQYYQEFFNYNHFGIGSALTVILLLAIVPIMYFNIRQFRRQEAQK